MQVVKIEETNKRFVVVARLEEMEANWTDHALWSWLKDVIRFEDRDQRELFLDTYDDRSCFRTIDRAKGLKSDAVYAQFMLQF